MIKKSLSIALISASLVVMGCSSDDEGTPAATTSAGGTTDVGTTDAATTDAGTTDAATTDAGTTDAATTDGGTTDAATTDGGTTDAATTDGGTTDGDGGSGYPAGSLADVVFQDGRATDALAALKTLGLDLSLNDAGVEWTVFLPTNEALAAFEGDVNLLTHVYDVAAVDSTQATALSGSSIAMNDGTSLAIGGGGTEALTIGGAEVIGPDLTGNASPSIVHIIANVLAAP